MQIGMVGLGRMGGNMALRLLRAGHEVVGYDLDEDVVRGLADHDLEGASSLEALAEKLDPPRHIWMMVPSGPPVDAALDALAPFLDDGDVLIDGGNSDYRDTLNRHDRLLAMGIHLVDVGTSGGVWGLENGYCLMAGGGEEPVARLAGAFRDLAADGDAGWGRMGPAGSGHFAKMIHNGIEYGMMQAIAEGFAVMEAKKEFGIDLHQVAEVWRHGSVVRAWLLDLTAALLKEDPALAEIAAYVPDSGEGRWTVREAIDLNVAAPVITTSLLQRIESRDPSPFAHRLLSGMRQQFGGHEVKRAE
jgi:6-phosphogluconate dehydrogenase